MLKLFIIILILAILVWIYFHQKSSELRYQDLKPIQLSTNKTNPSLLKLRPFDRNRLNAHYACMLQEEQGWLKSKPINTLALLDHNFNIIREVLMTMIETPQGPTGLHNIKLFYDGDEIGFMGTTNNLDKTGKERNVVGTLRLTEEQAVPENILGLTGYRDDLNHSHWTINTNNSKHVIVSYRPLRVLKCENDVLSEAHVGYDLKGITSSTPLIRFDRGLLCIGNDTDGYNRIILMDKTYNVLKMSGPFSLTNKGELVSNVCDNGKEILVGYSNNGSFIRRIPYHAIKTMF